MGIVEVRGSAAVGVTLEIGDNNILRLLAALGGLAFTDRLHQLQVIIGLGFVLLNAGSSTAVVVAANGVVVASVITHEGQTISLNSSDLHLTGGADLPVRPAHPWLHS